MALPVNVMDPLSMKKLLEKSKEEPVNAAMGLLASDGTGRMLLHKIKFGQSLVKELEKDAGKLKSFCFGTAQVDEEDDPKEIKLTVNMKVGGLAKRLTKTLKGTGYRKVVILASDGTVLERAGGDDSEEEEGSEAVAAPVAAPPSPPPPPGPPPSAGPSPEAAQLTTRLRILGERLKSAIEAAPDRKAALLGLASIAQTSLKAGDLGRAATAIDGLSNALGPAKPPPPSGNGIDGVGSGVAFQKMRLLWDGTRKHLQEQLQALEAAVVEQSSEEADAADIRGNVVALEESLATLDASLSGALDDLYEAGGQDPALKQTARQIAERYQAFVASDPLMQELDANPFMPTDARKRLEATIAAIVSKL